MIDLHPFCADGADGADHPYIKPWSRGVSTYATDRNICVRVPRTDSIPENDIAPDVDKALFDKYPLDENAVAVQIPALPERRMAICPHCNCVFNARFGVMVGDYWFDRDYLALIAALPNVKFYPRNPGKPPQIHSVFIFDGGIGAVMPRSRE